MQNIETQVTDVLIAELKVKHGQVLHLATEDGEAVFRSPNRHEWAAYLAALSGDDKATATRDLVFQCCVWPAAPEFLKLTEKRPGIVLSFGGELVEFAGVKKTQIRKVY
jgi:hypothetical protein